MIFAGLTKYIVPPNDEASFDIVAKKDGIYLNNYDTDQLTELIPLEKFRKANPSRTTEAVYDTSATQGTTSITTSKVRPKAFVEEYIFTQVSGVLYALRSNSLEDVHTMCTKSDHEIPSDLKLNSDLNWIKKGLSKNELGAVTKVVEALKSKTSLILAQKRTDGSAKDEEIIVYECNASSGNDASFCVVARNGNIYIRNRSEESEDIEFMSFNHFVRAICAPGIDLSKLDLQNIDLSNKNLSGINFMGSDLRNGNFSYTILLSTILNEANACRTKFYGAKMNASTALHRTKLQGADLRQIDPENYKYHTTAIMNNRTLKDSADWYSRPLQL